MAQSVRTRFAPSPTGSLHIGGVRTALFNWLYAKRMGGKFLLRIEDTDQERSTIESEQEIIESMMWLGMIPDGVPVKQSERSANYAAAMERLLREKKAYRCVCTPERLTALREECMAEKRKPKYDGKCRHENIGPDSSLPFVVRIDSSCAGESLRFEDTLRGVVTFDAEELDDFIIQRSDGGFIYNFVVAIDDYEMGITHVIRGNDHLSNTPKQLIVYRALGLPEPKFTHLSMILNDKRQKLSKRDGVSSVLEYKKAGYLPEAIINFLVRLGWSFGDKEIFTPEELFSIFGIDSLNKADAVFNSEKFLWVNAQHLKMQAPEKLLTRSLDWLQANDADTSLLEANEELFIRAVPFFVEKAKTLADLYASMLYLLQVDFPYEEKATEKFSPEASKPLVREFLDRINVQEDFSHSALDTFVKSFVEEKAIPFKDLAQPMRVALTGRAVSPGIAELLAVLGKAEGERRIRRFLDTSFSK